VRILALAACLMAFAAPARAQSAPAPESPEAKYDAQKKSVALAVTLEALSPIAGLGAFYAHDTDRGLFLSITSTLAAGAGVGAVFWLIHLDHQQESGFNRAVNDVEEGAAISLLATAAIVYVVARVSGLVLAPEATAAFNDQLRVNLGIPPEPIVPAHALAPGLMLTVRF
jgi:hypothetical protein